MPLRENGSFLFYFDLAGTWIAQPRRPVGKGRAVRLNTEMDIERRRDMVSYLLYGY